MTTQPQPIADLDYDVAVYLELTERIEQLTSQHESVMARVDNAASASTRSSAASPCRPPAQPVGHLERAAGFLTDQQREVCNLDGDGAKKVKRQLSEVRIDECMDEGRGAPRVGVK